MMTNDVLGLVIRRREGGMKVWIFILLSCN
jgi:hypothetical protein